MKLPRKIPWILPDKPHLDHVWFDHGDRRGITFQDRWKPNLQLGFQVTLTAGYYQWLFTPRHKLPVLLDIGHHLIHLLHWVPRTRIRDQELPAGSRSSLPLALTQSLPKNQVPKKTWMIHYFIPVEALDDRVDVSFIGNQVCLFFFFTFYYFVYVCMEHVESREKNLILCVYVWNMCGDQRKSSQFFQLVDLRNQIWSGLYAWCQVPLPAGPLDYLKKQSFVAHGWS